MFPCFLPFWETNRERGEKAAARSKRAFASGAGGGKRAAGEAAATSGLEAHEVP